MARIPNRGAFQPSRQGQDLQREGRSLAHATEGIDRRVVDLENRQTPIGAIVLFPDFMEPDGWLLAHGATISRRTYSELFEVIGENFGAGDGLTTYDLPDLSGVEPAGFDYWIRSGVYA